MAVLRRLTAHQVSGHYRIHESQPAYNFSKHRWTHYSCARVVDSQANIIGVEDVQSDIKFRKIQKNSEKFTKIHKKNSEKKNGFFLSADTSTHHA